MYIGTEDRRTFVITGGTSGVGKALTKSLLEENVRLVLIVRSKEKADELVAEFNNTDKIEFVYADLVDVEKLSDALSPYKCQDIDGFVHCAGIVDLQSLRKTTTKKFERLMRINFLSFVEILRVLLLAKTQERRFRVVSMSSASSFRADRSNHMYSASKAAMEAFMRSVCGELINQNVEINCIQPCYIDTPMLKDQKMYRGDVFDRWLGASQPLGVISPDEIAEQIKFMLYKRGAKVTGTSIYMNGGML